MNGDRETAKEHIKWEMSVIRTCIESVLQITEKLLIDNFEHGMKHGREAYFCSEDKYRDYLNYIAKSQEMMK